MAFETELKFLDIEFNALREKLTVLGGKCKGRHLERNVVFDTPEREFKNNEKLLRLRTKQWKNAHEAVLTLKLPPEGEVPADVKIYDERETKVENFDGTYAILEGLGYDGAFRYDKVREEWSLNDIEICLDELSFANVVELEGEREGILKLAALLELPLDKSSTGTYHDLHREYRKRNHLEPQDSFYFTDDEYQQHLDSL